MKSDLIFVPPKVTVDLAVYTEHILDSHPILFWHQTFKLYGWTKVVKDNAPGHKKWAIACRERNGVDVLNLHPQSPDINLIGALWGDQLGRECS